VQLFVIFFSRPVEFGAAAAISIVMLLILLRSAMTAEGPSGLSRMMARPTTKFIFGFAFIAWAVLFGIGLQLVPHEGANSPYGGLALIAMFSGVFIMMGLLWAVIGD